MEKIIFNTYLLKVSKVNTHKVYYIKLPFFGRWIDLLGFNTDYYPRTKYLVVYGK